jgi:S-formylglutathione hydrolase FrmB
MLRAIDGLAAVSLTDWWPVRGVVLAVTVLVGLLVLRYARRITSILLSTAVFAGLVLSNLVLADNAYYRTYPSLRSWLDGAPADGVEATDRLPDAGQTLPVRIPTPASGFVARPALVHLPRAWFADPRPSLPVLMLLPGVPGAPQEWVDQGTADAVADRWAAAHSGVAPIIVIPDLTGEGGLGVCADTATGAVERYLTADVPAYLQAEFGTPAPGPRWAVAGHSAGGTCALTLALRHPDMFPTVAAFGGSAGGADAAHDPAQLLPTRAYPELAVWFEDTEPAAGATTQFVALARAAAVSTCHVVRTGAQPGIAAWSLALADALPWLAARVGQVPLTPDLTAHCAPAGP